MKYVLAVSGGVDSVVLLDMVCGQVTKDNNIAKGNGKSTGSRIQNTEQVGVRPGKSGMTNDDIVVAHYDHGIRAESGGDAEFVQGLAEKYGVEFVLGDGKLGPNANEERARKKRYEFLRGVIASAAEHLPRTVLGSETTKQSRNNNASRTREQLDWILNQVQDDNARIVTAHHQDDLIETILINLVRGTGWRGLAPLWSDDIERPLLGTPKAEIISYAIKNNLDWVEDETNYSPQYFRNRIRDLVARMTPDQRKQLLELYESQKKIRTEIENILDAKVFSNRESINKNDIISLPKSVAMEVLRSWTGGKLTRPQTERLLKFLKTAKSGDMAQPGGGVQISLYRDNITIMPLNKTRN